MEKTKPMTAELTTIIGQLRIVDGVWQSEALNQIAVREPTNGNIESSSGKGDLFVLTNILGDITDIPVREQRLAEIVRDSYYLARGSVTASLRRALQTAGDYLYHYNAKRAIEERVVGGVVALVVCQENVFVAHLGPTAFYTISKNTIQRYPQHSIWLDDSAPATNDNEIVLGINAFVEPNIFHVQVQPQDMLILADSHLVETISPSQLQQTVNGNNIRTAMKNLGQLVNQKDCSALALSVVEASHSKFSGLAMPVSTHLQKLLPIQSKPENSESEPFPISATATTPSPLERLAQFNPFKKSHSTTEEALPEPAHDDPTWSPQPSKMMAATAPEPAFEPQLQSSEANMGQTFRNVGAFLLMMVATVANSLKNLLGSSEDDQPRQAGRQATSFGNGLIPWRTMLGVAIAIPLVVAAVVAISYLRNERLKETEYATLLASAQDKVEQAIVVEDGSALSLIAEAENLLVQADTINPAQPEVAALRTKMAANTDTVSKVQRFTAMPHLRSYTDVGMSLHSILVQGVELYVLDNGTHRIYHHRLDNNGTGLLADDDSLLLVQQGQMVGDVTVNSLVDMVWMPAGGNRQTSDLLVLDNNSHLLEFNPNWGITSISFNGQGDLVRPIAIESYFGNFYVLDPQANRILRYLPTADGYNAAPEDYFPPDQPIDVTQAVDFAIDGAVYVLYLDGRIAKFSGGRPTDFTLTGLDKPFKMPTAIFTAPDETVQYLYIADTGNQRIVQLDKNGQFIRQFKPKVEEGVPFSNLQDIFVDEIGERIYVLDNNNLYLAMMPTQ